MVIFVSGNSRSGTTMMGRILNKHPEINTFQELHYFDEVVAPFEATDKFDIDKAVNLFATLISIDRQGYFGKREPKKYYDEAMQVLHGKTKFDVIELHELFLHYITGKKHKKYPCEQTPQNIFYLQELLENISNVKVIVMVRDPRDVMLSQKNKWKRKQLTRDKYPWFEALRARVNYHPITICKIWKSVVNELTRLKDDTRVMIIKYEELVGQPEIIMKKVCEFVGVDYHKGMINVPKIGSSNEEDSSENYGIDSTRSGRWREGGLTSAELAICQQMLGDKMLVYGYEHKKVTSNPMLYIWYVISMPFKMGIALFFNLKRAKDPVRIWKKLFS